MAQPSGQQGLGASSSPTFKAPSTPITNQTTISPTTLQQLIVAQGQSQSQSQAQILASLNTQQQQAALQALTAQRMANHAARQRLIEQQAAAMKRSQLVQTVQAQAQAQVQQFQSQAQAQGQANVSIQGQTQTASTPVVLTSTPPTALRTALSTNASASLTPTTGRPQTSIALTSVTATPKNSYESRVALTNDGNTETRRRRDEGFRGSMRGEIARLMYSAGDVANPELDSVDYMEDLVVEFLSDLCRPVGPLRPSSSAAHQAIPLSAEIVRHRLSTHSHMRKYLTRWDHMTYMSSELAASRRVAMPSHQDLIASVGKEFLGIEDESGAGGAGAGAVGATGGGDMPRERKKRQWKEGKERKKPGPKKGFKRDPSLLVGNRHKRGPYKKKVPRPDSATASPIGIS